MKYYVSLPQVTILTMFPLVAETIYSPALPQIACAFSVTAEQAGQTISLYFIAFALGLVFWGRLCDHIGRRPTMLIGLATYGAASVSALVSPHFAILLGARLIAAFGAAVGSVCTQTMMRDTYTGADLAKCFSMMGIAIALSPAIGMACGATLVSWFGYRGVFAALAFLAVVLFFWAAARLPETKPLHVIKAPLGETLLMMLRDVAIWRTAVLVALFNLAVFGYYQLAPFEFERLGLSSAMFGISSVAIAFGVMLGSLLSRHLLQAGWTPEGLILLASVLAVMGGILVFIMASSWIFVLPVAVVMLAYGLAIPNILAIALSDYGDRTGTAGALLGLLYYLMLGGGLVCAAWSQNVELVLLSCGFAALTLALACYRQSRSS
ncbi:Bcr/CflA family efflux MFS transporter [Rhodoligotrophos ferricapiens]|uniref:Bcr/CflA family efflux MFS transporter n=1 Tax=Rhodoligotrophos ferricapiens TaxID=3069264 RepID=UPI00315D77B3